MKTRTFTLLIAALGGLAAGPAVAAGNPCAKNPCAKPANPCAKPANPCAKPANPCAAKPGLDPKRFTRPAGYKPQAGDAKLGKKLWNDTGLSSNGMSCNTCHVDNGSFQASFAKPYPHAVAMVTEQSGVKRVHLDEMVQVCMLAPMAADALPWKSKELAALTAYARSVQKTFRPGGKASAAPANPCSAKPANPCAAKPANPCAKK